VSWLEKWGCLLYAGNRCILTMKWSVIAFQEQHQNELDRADERRKFFNGEICCADDGYEADFAVIAANEVLCQQRSINSATGH
jgi:hypothetical protein